MFPRPDRPLVVKCTFDRWNKRITFTSARNCSYDLLRNKIEQCFSLYATSYVIAYKDDDGEVTDITTESDLTEAIQYFQAGSDDPPLSSAASILSGRSFGSKRITLRVHVTVDYDGPSLSDTSSLASLEEYKGRNGSSGELNWAAAAGVGADGELDDDSVTVSSRDNSRRYANGTVHPSSTSRSPLGDRWIEDLDSFSIPEESVTGQSYAPPDGASTDERTWHEEGPFSDRYQSSAAERYPENPEAVFEMLRLQEEAEAMPDHNHPHAHSASPFDQALSLSAQDRGAAWLRDQNARTIKAMLGATPEPSESDSRSISLSYSDDQPSQENMGGDLALQRDPRGKYYYSYTGGSSATHDSGYEDSFSTKDENERFVGSSSEHIRPNSMQLTWLASQQKLQDEDHPSESLYKRPSPRSSTSEPIPYTVAPDIPPEVLQFVAPAGPPPGSLTACSECGVLLDAIRYVCAMCGEKEPVSSSISRNGSSVELGKGKERDFDPVHTYPPSAHHTHLSSPPSSFFESATLSGSPHSRIEHPQNKPLPSLPTASSSPTLYSARGSGPRSDPENTGYELCSGCIEAAGIYHALRASTERMGSTGSEPTSPEDALSLWRRSAPRQKGQLRHAYFEKVWGHHGWEDVEQEDMLTCKCSTCNSTIVGKRYKCASCQKFNLCRACYSQVHDIHPAHSFLVVIEKPVRSKSEPDFLPTIVTTHDNNEEQSMKHPGVKCAHCMQDILGARFHCAICDSVDICSNCESAGLPGNLDSSDGGHISSHIMIKIPYPLETNEVQTASRRAIHLWTGRDAAHVLTAPRSKPSSVYSSYAQTVVGSRMQLNAQEDTPEDHHVICKGCNKTIFGTRYQCATCPSSPHSFSLCASCEEHSYKLHDPMHSFFKLPRPVHRPLESTSAFLPKLYKVPAGPVGGLAQNTDPKEYLSFLIHSTALCDRCMEHIHGAWFRCAYCAKDLCGDCEALDTHDATHVFVVFKAPVDMPHFRQFANLENPNDSPPIIPFPVYL
ncbi:hypothetical protein HYDPIDRAFT_95335 [Hydnomerulius pinastri MD-312]|uniref:ZZ-type domain-containing protein n=1 Tax=Hydnomerulius pinastri MD-312 TaxID=994086 RepID=A0A0C9VV30_9AGAM|nr:hypothetical protein HYDPIDRAFT_95335 [Hydnomerulius pinastri MD-312]